MGRPTSRRKGLVSSLVFLFMVCHLLCTLSSVMGFVRPHSHLQVLANKGLSSLSGKTYSHHHQPAKSRRARGDFSVVLEPPMRYNSEGWFYDLISLPKSKIVKNIRTHLIANTAWAFLIGTIHETTSMELHVSPLPHTLITAALGLLLVFRTNASYGRFWEARQVWGSVTNNCRNIARTGYVTLDRRYHNRFARLVAAFPMTLRYHLQCLEQGKELDLLLGPVEANEIRQDPNPPAAISNKLTHLIVNAVHSQHQRQSSDQMVEGNVNHHMAPPDVVPRQGLNGNMMDVQYLYLQKLVGELINCLGMCERILMTPIPPSYSRHTSRLLSIYCLTLPFVLVEQLDMFMVPATVALCWGLFSIEEIGHYIEEPFRNQLPLERYTTNIRRDVERLMMVKLNDLTETTEDPSRNKIVVEDGSVRIPVPGVEGRFNGGSGTGNVKAAGFVWRTEN